MKQIRSNGIGLKNTVVLLFSALVLTAFPHRLLAQDGDRTTHTIEVRDGKVMVNGEVVSELEGDDYRIVFRKGDEGSVAVFGDDTRDGFFAFNDIFDGYRLRSGTAPDFDVRSGSVARFFPELSERDPFVFNLDGDVAFGAYSGGFPSAEVMRLEQKARRLADRIRRDDGNVAEMEAELDETLEQIFDLKMESRTERMQQLESKLQQLNEQIDQRQADREAIIEQRKQELLGHHGRYEW